MKTKIYKKGDEDFQKNVLAVSKRFKGKGGDADSESAIMLTSKIFKMDLFGFPQTTVMLQI